MNTDMHSRIMSVKEFGGKRQCRDCYNNATKKTFKNKRNIAYLP